MQGRTTKYILLSLTLISWLLKLWASSKKLQKVDLDRKIQLFKDRFKSCFDTAKSKISTNAAIPAKNMGLQNKKFDFFKIALNRVLTLADYRSRRELSGSSGIIDFENNRVCKQFKHWNYRISVPMSILMSSWNDIVKQILKMKN